MHGYNGDSHHRRCPRAVVHTRLDRCKNRGQAQKQEHNNRYSFSSVPRRLLLYLLQGQRDNQRNRRKQRGYCRKGACLRLPAIYFRQGARRRGASDRHNLAACYRPARRDMAHNVAHIPEARHKQRKDGKGRLQRKGGQAARG